jgi:hypothetical protein
MQHIALIIKGERDYTKITGSTGPLVYPGAHVWIYKQLFKITDEGRDIQRAQYIFALVYLGALALVFQCYRKARVSIFFKLPLLQRIKLTTVGPAICLPPSHPVKTPAQYFPAAMFQRLLRCSWLIRRAVLLPARSMARG